MTTIALEIIGSFLVLGALASVSWKRYSMGFRLNILSAVAWGTVALETQLWGLLVLQGVIAVLGFIGLWRHRAEGV